jgi:hypothetical protein
MSSYFMRNRLKIANYSSELKARIDIQVETYIAENQNEHADIDKANKAREEWIKELHECEVENLAELEKREDRDTDLDYEQLLKRFCFIFEFHAHVVDTGCYTSPLAWRFISTDIYISQEQIGCFQVMISCLDFDSGEFDYAQHFPMGFESLEILFKTDRNKNVINRDLKNSKIYVCFIKKN